MFINDHSNERQHHTLSFDTKFVNVQQIFPKIFKIFIFQPGDQSHGIAHKLNKKWLLSIFLVLLIANLAIKWITITGLP